MKQTHTIHFVTGVRNGKNIKLPFSGTKAAAKAFARTYAVDHHLNGLPCYIWEGKV